MAHDGSGWGRAAPRLKAAARTGLTARCVCGLSEWIDPAPWLAQGLGEATIRSMEVRLRCRCGARRIRLEVALERPQPAATSGIYRFR